MKAISQMMGRSEAGAVETSRIRYQHIAYIPADQIDCKQWLQKEDIKEIIS